ncbi:tyrosine-protein kinase receptor Tie-1-like [Amphiura filiformis]|uniref:tyrosine-protein kinase receptor Tie-1-like n=1 Tax=Amphiura filiformis TaxID=82378 RepID=UPI003B21F7CC
MVMEDTHPSTHGKVICKISDFELAVTLRGETTFIEKEKIRLEVRWMAPECLAQGCFSTKSDVWAFGVVMWELFSKGSKPYAHYTSTHATARDVQKGVLRLDCPKDCEKRWFDRIMSPCWNKNPSRRPDFNRLERLLAQELKTLE